MRRRFLLWSLLLLCVFVAASCLAGMVSMPGRSYAGPAIAADAAVVNALRADVTQLAVVIGERNAVNRPEKVVAMLALETMGYFSDEKNTQHSPWPFSTFYPTEGNFIAFVADTTSRALVRDVVSTFRQQSTLASEGASVLAAIEGIDWSDHGPYWRAGSVALMVTDTAPFRDPNYHHESDVPDTLDFTRLANVAVVLRRVVAKLASVDGVQ